MKKFCIGIPVYKENLDLIDKLSLERLHKVVENKYDIYLIRPKYLDCKNYYKILGYKNIAEIVFDDKYFKDIKSYSQLCLQYDFYDKFSNYEYLYIYQTDCYLFRDELELWCDKGYDFIGGPIISSLSGWAEPNKPWKPIVGNGGFSLRKIDKFKEITDPNGEYRTYYNITDEVLNNIEFEDKYFCKFVYNKYEFNVPNWIVASKFSFDMNVNFYYEQMGYQGVPMGCHAWPKNIRYWQSHCEEMNNPEIVNLCEKKYKEYFEIYYKDFEEKRKLLIEREQEAIKRN